MTRRRTTTKPAPDPRTVGGTYRDGYWNLTYTVLSADDINGMRRYSVRWADGSTTSHITAWDPRRDKVVGS